MAALAVLLGGAGLIVAALMGAPLATLRGEDEAFGADELRVTARATEDGWRYGYPAYGLSHDGPPNGPPLLAPAGARVVFDVTSAGPIRRFAPPGFGETTALPGRLAQLSATAPSAPELLLGPCCGGEDGPAPVAVEIATPAAFVSWVRCAEAQGPTACPTPQAKTTQERIAAAIAGE